MVTLEAFLVHLAISRVENGGTLWSCHGDCHWMMHLMTVLSAMLRNILTISRSIQTFLRSLNTEQFPGRQKTWLQFANKCFSSRRGGSSSVIASVYSVSLPHVPCPTAGCLSIPRLGQLHHIFRFIMSNHFENLSLSFYILHKLLCLSFESLSVFCFKMSSNVVNFPSEYLVCLQPDIWKTLLQGTSQIKINLSGCSMITKSFQKFGESSLKTVLWPPAIKLEFQPMCSLRLETYLYL